MSTFAQQPTKKRKKLTRTEKQSLIYDNHSYLSAIKTVQIHPEGKEAQFPIYVLGSNEKLSISFDDLRADNRPLYFTVDLCNADWTPCRLPKLDYLQGLGEDRIYDMQSSENTLTAYTHYRFTFPTDNINPKLAGNYLLKVYEDADNERLIFTRKIFVLNGQVSIDSDIIPSTYTNRKITNQKINLEINSTFDIVNPQNNFQVQVFQNQRWDNIKVLKTPSQIATRKITFTNPNTLDFEGNNEFKTIDLRSIKNTSTGIYELRSDSVYSAIVYSDQNTSKDKYTPVPDENGQFFIRNLDSDYSDVQNEYFYTYFSLKDSENIEGDIYLVGAFNNYQKSEQNKLLYNPQNKLWETKQILKQGLYNYDYVVYNDKKLSTRAISGSHFETENTYQILIYYRKPGTFWDELVGFKNIKKTKQ